MSSYWHAFTLPLEETLRRIISFVPRLLVTSILFLLFYGLARLIRRMIRRSLQRLPHFPVSVRILIARSTYILVLLLGLMVALSAANVDITAVVASLGVAGFALGFALKDILENFLAGILLLFARPFEVGDQVTLGAFEGTVKDIQIRTTTLHTYNEESVAIPNSQIYTNPVINHTRLGRRRYSVAFDTSLKADMQQVEQAVLQLARTNANVAAHPDPFIRITGVNSGNDVLSWRLFYWAAPTKAVEVQTISELLEGVKATLYDVGVPTPTATSATILQRDGQHTLPTDPAQLRDGAAR
jgi:small-conductance mechanosensitive channel